MTPVNHQTSDVPVDPPSRRAETLNYTSVPPQRRNRAGAVDWILAGLTGGCYVLAWYATSNMRREFASTDEWEHADFLMNAAAISASIVFVTGCLSAHRTGWRRTSVPALSASLAAGALTVLMFLQLLFWLGFYLLWALLLGWPILLAYALMWYLVRRVDRGDRQRGFEVGRPAEHDTSAPPGGRPKVVPTPESEHSK